jgi:hypothetical protein
MIWGEGEDGDGLAEAVAALVRLDGFGCRCPWEFCRLFSIKVRSLPAGRVEGYFDARTLTIYINLAGHPAVVRGRLAHEIGHVILFLLGYTWPHDESLAGRAGRSWCIGRLEMLAAIHTLQDPREICLKYCGFLPLVDIEARIWEVQVTILRDAG